MKILSIRLKNINSLRGEHYIPFHESPLSDSGLFAIVGPTGAGKTSILDAITLALYGYAPRFGVGAAEKILSYHTADCYAEVDFETKDHAYRSKWMLRRAHNRLDGELQPVRMELTDLATGQLLESKLTEVRNRVTALTGLDYPRFLRSVLLAQGDFAAFLKAKENEKGDLLEKITGTDLYTRLSKKAFQRRKSEEEKLRGLLKRLEDNPVLAAPEVEQMQGQVAHLEAARHKLAGLCRALEAQQQWLADIRSLSVQQDSLARKLAERQAEKARLADDFRRLEWHQRAAAYQAPLQEHQVIQAEIVRLDQALRTLHESLPSSQGAQDKAASLYAEARQRLTDLETEKTELEPRLARAMRLAADRENTQARLTDIRRELGHLERKRSQHSLPPGLDAAPDARHARRLAEALQLRTRELAQMPGHDSLLEAEQTSSSQLEHWQRQRDLARQHDRTQQELASLRQQYQDQRTAASLLETELAALESREAEARSRLADQQHIHALEVKVQHYEQARTQLVPGQACPLCGATHHPFAMHAPPSEALAELERRQAESDALLLQFIEVRQQLSEAKGMLHMLKKQGENHKERAEALASEYREQAAGCTETVDISDLERMEAAVARCTQARQHHRTQLLRHEALRAEIAWLDLAFQADELHKRMGEEESLLRRNQTEIRELIGEADPEHVRKRLDSQWKAGMAHRDRAENEFREKSAHYRLQAERAATHQADHDRHAARLAEKERQLLRQLAAEPFATIEALREVLLDEATERRLLALRQTLDADLNRLQGAWHQAGESLAVRQAENLTADTPETVAQALAAARQQYDQALAESTRLVQTLERNAEALGRNQQLEDDIAAQRRESARWETLGKLIGSATGAEFNTFAQGLTLAQLVQLANRYLDQLNPRYQIRRMPETDLDLEILDRDQADNIRPLSTLSGGETFLVSLALALGLSDIAGRKARIESLFIDEGFGTLDPRTLDVAITTLENLQATGKMIGVISHVEALKDRITTQVQVVRQPGGNSVVRIAG